MSKPSWDDAPEWAEWLAMDEDREWYWYENEPLHYENGWFSRGREEFAGCYESHFLDSKERRQNA